MKELETREEAARRMGGKPVHRPPPMNRAELATGKKVSPILLVGRIICGALMVVGAMAMATGNDFGAVLLVGAFIAMLITFLTSFF